MEKVFITLKNLPGGIKTGTSVEFINGQWIFDNGNICYYDPRKEPEFFKIDFKTKFKIDDDVYLTEECAKRFKLSANSPVRITYAKAVSERKANYEIVVNYRKYAITDKDIYKVTNYYFLSSKGVIQNMPITERHEKSFEYAYRKAIGNYFETKEAVQEKLDSIKKTMVDF